MTTEEIAQKKEDVYAQIVGHQDRMNELQEVYQLLCLAESGAISSKEELANISAKADTATEKQAELIAAIDAAKMEVAVKVAR